MIFCSTFLFTVRERKVIRKKIFIMYFIYVMLLYIYIDYVLIFILKKLFIYFIAKKTTRFVVKNEKQGKKVET